MSLKDTLTIFIRFSLFFNCGGMVEWLMAADCNSARASVRRFKSCSLHHLVYCFPHSENVCLYSPAVRGVLCKWLAKRTWRILFLTLKRPKFSNGLFRVRLAIKFPVKQGINREIFYFSWLNIGETERNHSFTMTSDKNNREFYKDMRVSKLPIMILRTPASERLSRFAIATSD